MLRELLKCSILISVVGCSSVPKEDNSSILMEDVIVERTTVRSTTQNPKPKSTGGVHISGDNINIGTIIVNSPGAKVDNSTTTTTNTQINQINQQQNNSRNSSGGTGSQETSALFARPSEPAYHTDRDFFKGLDGVVMKFLPSFAFGAASR
jgi:hypothetical protein